MSENAYSNIMIDILVLLGGVSILTVAVLDALRLTIGQIFSLLDSF